MGGGEGVAFGLCWAKHNSTPVRGTKLLLSCLRLDLRRSMNRRRRRRGAGVVGCSVVECNYSRVSCLPRPHRLFLCLLPSGGTDAPAGMSQDKPRPQRSPSLRGGRTIFIWGGTNHFPSSSVSSRRKFNPHAVRDPPPPQNETYPDPNILACLRAPAHVQHKHDLEVRTGRKRERGVMSSCRAKAPSHRRSLSRTAPRP